MYDVCMHVCISVCMCVCVYVCLYVCMYVYKYIYVCMCMCVDGYIYSVCVRALPCIDVTNCWDVCERKRQREFCTLREHVHAC
jgi:hypothetical protein